MNILTKIKLIFTNPKLFWSKISELKETKFDLLKLQFYIFVVVGLVIYFFKNEEFSLLLKWLSDYLSVPIPLAALIYYVGSFYLSVIIVLLISFLLFLFVNSFNKETTFVEVYRVFVNSTLLSVILYIPVALFPEDIFSTLLLIVTMTWHFYVLMLGISLVNKISKKHAFYSIISYYVVVFIIVVIIIISTFSYLLNNIVGDSKQKTDSQSLLYGFSTTSAEHTYSNGDITFKTPSNLSLLFNTEDIFIFTDTKYENSALRVITIPIKKDILNKDRQDQFDYLVEALKLVVTPKPVEYKKMEIFGQEVIYFESKINTRDVIADSYTVLSDQYGYIFSFSRKSSTDPSISKETVEKVISSIVFVK